MPADGSVQRPLRIVIGSDNAGHTSKTALKAELERNPGVSKILDVGVTDADDSTAYPHVAIAAGTKIVAGEVCVFHHLSFLIIPQLHADIAGFARQTGRYSSAAPILELPSQPTKFRVFERSPPTTPTALNGLSSATMLKYSASGSG